jgi:hypothetical protein
MSLTGEKYTTALRHVREEIVAHVINPNAIEGETDGNQEAETCARGDAGQAGD